MFQLSNSSSIQNLEDSIRHSFLKDGKPVIVPKEEFMKQLPVLSFESLNKAPSAYAKIVLLECITNLLETNRYRFYSSKEITDILGAESWKAQIGLMMSPISAERDNDIVAKHLRVGYVYAYAPECAEHLRQKQVWRYKGKCHFLDCTEKCPVYRNMRA